MSKEKARSDGSQKTRSFGVYKLDQAPLVPSRLLQKKPLDENREGHWFQDASYFAVGEEVDKAEREERKITTEGDTWLRGVGEGEIFSNFKADLAKERGRKADNMRRYQPSSKEGHLQKPRDVATAFIGTLLHRIVDTLSELQEFEGVTYKVYFTQPAKEESLSDSYQSAFSKYIIPALKKGFERVEFPERQGGKFLFEPYGVYHYSMRALRLFKGWKEEERPIFLVLDVGGATTDISIVQAKPGKGEKGWARPISESVPHAGNQFDEILIRHLRIEKNRKDENGESFNEEPFSEEEIRALIGRDRVMRKVQQHKEKVSRRGGSVEFPLRGRAVSIDEDVLHATFNGWWKTVKKAIKRLVSEAEKRAADRFDTTITSFASFDKVLLAGGATQTRAHGVNLLRYHLAESFEKIDIENVVAPEDLDNHASTLASLGLAADVRDHREGDNEKRSGIGRIQEAEHIQARFQDENGESLYFRRRPVIDEETGQKRFRSNPSAQNFVHLAAIDEIKGEGDSVALELSWDCFEPVHFDRKNPPQKVTLKVKTDLPSDNGCNAGSADLKDIPEKCDRLLYKMEVNSPSVEGASLNYYHASTYGGRRAFAENQYNDDKVPTLGEVVPHVEVTLPLERDYVTEAEDVVICIDLGMSNTTASVYAPGKSLPEDHFDLVNLPHLKLPEDIPEEGHNGKSTSDDESLEAEEANLEAGGTPRERQGVDETSSKSQERNDRSDDKNESERVNGRGETINNERKEQAEKVDFDAVTNALENIRGAIDEGTRLAPWSMRPLLTRLDDISSWLEFVSLSLSGESLNAADADPRPKARAKAEELYRTSTPVNYSQVATCYSFEKFKEFVGTKGYIYGDRTLRTVWAQTMSPTNQLVVLAGPPGTGKTSLVGLLAEFFNPEAGSDQTTDGETVPRRSKEVSAPFCEIISVSPSWFSPSSLLGSYSEVDRTFHPKPFLEYAIQAEEVYEKSGKKLENSRKFFICLDEFNLAHPEQYLSSVLSLMELEYSPERHGFVVCKGENFKGGKSEAPEDLTLRLPPNLKLFATINTDVASKHLSPKVLDRALFERIVPELNQIVGFANAKRLDVKKQTSVFEPFFDDFIHPAKNENDQKLIKELFTLAMKAQVHMSFRVFDRITEHLLNHPFRYAAETQSGEDSTLNSNEVKALIDEIICNFFLPKMPGAYNVNGREYSDYLSRLIEGEEGHHKKRTLGYYPQAKKLLKRLKDGSPGQSAL